MKIDFSPLSQKINDEVINNYLKKEGLKYKILSSLLCKKVFIGMCVATLFNLVVMFFIWTITKEVFILLFYFLIPTLMPVFLGLLLFVLREIQLIKYKKCICLSEFANINGLKYVEKPVYKKYPGLIFNIGHDSAASDMLIKESALVSYEIANYCYTEGSGDDSSYTKLSYIMIKLGHKLPHMVLDSKNNNFNVFGKSLTNLPVSMKNGQKMSLEGDFDKYFTLYAPKNYKRDALYIFTPDLMAAFIDKSGQYDAEVIDDMLFIYSNKPLDVFNIDIMKGIFNIINIIGEKAFSKSDRYFDEKVGDRSNDLIDMSGRRLKHHKEITIISFVSFIIFLMVISIFVSIAKTW
jgi:hypothetical protein